MEPYHQGTEGEHYLTSVGSWSLKGVVVNVSGPQSFTQVTHVRKLTNHVNYDLYAVVCLK